MSQYVDNDGSFSSKSDVEPNGMPAAELPSQSHVACLYIKRLLEIAAQRPEVPIENITGQNVDLTDVFMCLNLDSSSEAKDMWNLIDAVSRSDARIIDWLWMSLRTKFERMAADCEQLLGAGKRFTPEELENFLCDRMDTLRKKQKRLDVLLLERDAIEEAEVELTKKTMSDMVSSFEKQYLQEPHQSELASLIHHGENLQKGNVNHCLSTLQLHYYTPEKIAEVKSKVNCLETEKALLKETVQELEDKKSRYESLGNEFKVIADRYGRVQRERKVKDKILATMGNWSP